MRVWKRPIKWTLALAAWVLVLLPGSDNWAIVVPAFVRLVRLGAQDVLVGLPEDCCRAAKRFR